MAELNIIDKKGILILKDEYHINGAQKLKEIFIEALTKADELDIRLEGELNFDIAFLQLFYSAIKGFTELGIKVSLYTKSTESFIQVLKQSGFEQLNTIELYQE